MRDLLDLDLNLAPGSIAQPFCALAAAAGGPDPTAAEREPERDRGGDVRREGAEGRGGGGGGGVSAMAKFLVVYGRLAETKGFLPCRALKDPQFVKSLDLHGVCVCVCVCVQNISL